MIQMMLFLIKTVKKLKKQYLMIPIIQHQITMKMKRMKKKTTSLKNIILLKTMSVLSVVYEAHLFKTNMNVFNDLFKNKK